MTRDNTSPTSPSPQSVQGSDELSARSRLILQRAAQKDVDRIGYPTMGGATPAATYLNNAGSPYQTFKDHYCGHSKELEKELLDRLAAVFGLPPSAAFGYVTAGGMEANFAGLWWAKKALKARGCEQIVHLSSSQTHDCINKSCDMLEIGTVAIEAHRAGGLDIAALKEALGAVLDRPGRSTLGVVVSASIGTMKEGIVDDVAGVKEMLRSILEPVGVPYHLHADGAIYGVLLPVIAPGLSHHLFDTIDTLALSGHKFTGALGICGLALTTRRLVACGFGEAGLSAAHFADSRDGNNVIELYTRLNDHLGFFEPGQPKLQDVFSRCERNAIYLEQQLAAVVGHAEVQRNLLAISFPKPRAEARADEIGDKYSLMPISEGRFAAMIFPQLERRLLERFVADYAAACGDRATPGQA